MYGYALFREPQKGFDNDDSRREIIIINKGRF